MKCIPPRHQFCTIWAERSKVTQGLKVRCPTLQVVVDLARQQPLSRGLRDHLSRRKCGREEAEDVGAVAAVQQRVPVEKGRVNVHLVTHAEQMPGDGAVLAQLDSRQVTKHVTVNSCHTEREKRQTEVRGKDKENTLSL